MVPKKWIVSNLIYFNSKTLKYKKINIIFNYLGAQDKIKNRG